ncbi:MFS transporter [Pseudomonas vanderleydeniana]|uniref:MFS transporter n=1 Tax=Pseudomonas vanderleydeniana TaxID=2745495 RepID=A0A9E6PH29_9PSED|nr:MFS transporter [Pseudomonas vanderleydeniana]
MANLLILGSVIDDLAQDMHLSAMMLASVLSTFPASAIIGNLALLQFARALHPGRAFLTGHLLVMLGTLWLANAESLPSLLASRILVGLAMPLIGSNLYPLMCSFRQPFREKIAGLVASTGSLTTLSVVPLSLMLSEQFGWRTAIWVQGLLCTLALLLVLLSVRRIGALAPSQPGPGVKPDQTFTTMNLWRIGQFLALSLAFLSLSIGLPNILSGTVGTGMASAVLFSGGLAALGGGLCLSAFEKTRRLSPGFLHMACLASVLILCLESSTFSLLTVGWMGYCAFRQILSTQLLLQATEQCPPPSRSQLNAAFNLAFQLASAVAGSAAPFLMYSSNPLRSIVFFAGSALALAFVMDRYRSARYDPGK